MKKERYTITALVPLGQTTPLEFLSSIEVHRRVHAANIPEFEIRENTLKFVTIEFLAPPDPMTPLYPKQNAQDAASALICQEIRARYPGHGKLKLKIERQP